MVKNPKPVTQNELIYGLDDRPPPVPSFLAGLQHVLSGFVSIIAPPLMISAAIGLPFEQTNYVVSMACLISGVAIFIQAHRFGPIGSGMLSIQGTSFAFLGPLQQAGRMSVQAGASPSITLSMLLVMCFCGSFIEMIMSRFLHLCRRIITPLVAGIVVLLIGTTLIKVAITDMGGGYEAMSNGSFGSVPNLGLAFLVLAVIVICNMQRNMYLRMGSIVIGVIIGYSVAIAFGVVDFSPLKQLKLFSVPMPFRYWSLEGIRNFNWSAFVPIAIIYVFTLVESIGDLTATSMVSNQPISGPKYMDRIKAGVLGDGFNSMLASVFNTFPNTTFSQNNGIIQLTGVASRYVGYYAAAILVVLGVFPVVGGIFQCMPRPVLGGATFIMFGSVAVAGIKIIASQAMGRRELLILSISLGFGLGITFVPEIISQLPDMFKHVFSSGICAGGIAAMLLSFVLPCEKETTSLSKGEK